MTKQPFKQRETETNIYIFIYILFIDFIIKHVKDVRDYFLFNLIELKRIL